MYSKGSKEEGYREGYREGTKDTVISQSSLLPEKTEEAVRSSRL